MKKTFILGSLVLMFNGGYALAESKTVEGKIVKVVSSEHEIYVKSKDDGKKYEFYFKPETAITRKGLAAEFSELKQDVSVKVTAEKKGKRLDPKTVEILE